MRDKLRIPHPPTKCGNNELYQQAKKIYSSNLKASYSGYIFKPVDLTLEKIFDFHRSTLEKHNCIGNINIESQQQFDSKLVNVFYRYNTIKNVYGGKKVVGIRFHTKGS